MNLNILRKIIFIIFIIFIIIQKNIFFINIIYFFSYLKLKIEINKFEYYLNFCNKSKPNINIFYKNNNPSISIISPIYNSEKYIFRFIKNIENQNFYNIEIILVDDNSFDNSVKKIEKLQRNDKRIKLIKNKRNKGTLISRNLGILFSKGKYIILPDPDDILSKNILNICYKYAEKYHYEMIRFNCYMGKGIITNNKLSKNLEKKSIYQPKLTTYLYYGTGELNKIDNVIHNKFIKKEVFIRALNKLNNFYLNLYMIYAEDVLITHIIYITAYSFYFLKIIGYYYIKNNNSITRNIILKLKIKAIFIKLKLIYEYYKNTKYERDIINDILKIVKSGNNLNKIKNKIKFDNKDSLIIYNDIINKYLNCSFISDENKKILNNLKNFL
jgi:glycosyltransferase involved in cell wall biosynthesis